MRHECRRLEGELALSARQLESLQRQHDDALDRLAASSQAMLGAAAGDGAAGAGVPNTYLFLVSGAVGLSCRCQCHTDTAPWGPENTFPPRGPSAGGHVAFDQIRSVAEAAVRELRARLADREAALAATAEAARDHQASYLAQHSADRSEPDSVGVDAQQPLSLRHLRTSYHLTCLPAPPLPGPRLSACRTRCWRLGPRASAASRPASRGPALSLPQQVGCWLSACPHSLQMQARELSALQTLLLATQACGRGTTKHARPPTPRGRRGGGPLRASQGAAGGAQLGGRGGGQSMGGCGVGRVRGRPPWSWCGGQKAGCLGQVPIIPTSSCNNCRSFALPF
jgi:hypothetical protein